MKVDIALNSMYFPYMCLYFYPVKKDLMMLTALVAMETKGQSQYKDVIFTSRDSHVKNKTVS